MRLGIQILSAALLASVATAQTAPASQTVQQKPATSTVQNGTNPVKGPVKSPFASKAKPSQPTTPPASKSPVASKSQPPATTKKASLQAHPAATAKKASAQSATTKKPSVQAHPPATQQAKATPKTAKTVPSKTAVKKPVPAPAKTAVKSPAPVPVVAPPTKPVPPAVAQSAPAKLPNPGKRDPFLSPLSAIAARAPVASCSTGKHCLVVDQIALKGIVQTKEGNIAMVENGAKHSYYLHENDSLFDGSVEKITNDSVTFRQESSDVLGRPVSKEVVKKVSAPAV